MRSIVQLRHEAFSSSNIACGAHAGNLETMIETLELAAKRKVAVGAHPGFFDLENFGRRDIAAGGLLN